MVDVNVVGDQVEYAGERIDRLLEIPENVPLPGVGPVPSGPGSGTNSSTQPKKLIIVGPLPSALRRTS